VGKGDPEGEKALACVVGVVHVHVPTGDAGPIAEERG
jgi:hypothetical protein